MQLACPNGRSADFEGESDFEKRRLDFQMGFPIPKGKWTRNQNRNRKWKWKRNGKGKWEWKWKWNAKRNWKLEQEQESAFSKWGWEVHFEIGMALTRSGRLRACTKAIPSLRRRGGSGVEARRCGEWRCGSGEKGRREDAMTCLCGYVGRGLREGAVRV
jgi:hypothetical protein